MGAHNFETVSYGETAAEAFRDAVDDAHYAEGHNPYNGTISTNDSFIFISLKEGESLSEWRERILDDSRISKWGPCACIADPDEPIENGRTLWHFAGWAAC